MIDPSEGSQCYTKVFEADRSEVSYVSIWYVAMQYHLQGCASMNRDFSDKYEYKATIHTLSSQSRWGIKICFCMQNTCTSRRRNRNAFKPYNGWLGCIFYIIGQTARSTHISLAYL